MSGGDESEESPRAVCWKACREEEGIVESDGDDYRHELVCHIKLRCKYSRFVHFLARPRK